MLLLYNFYLYISLKNYRTELNESNISINIKPKSMDYTI